MEYTEIIYLISQIKEEDNIGNFVTSSETLKKVYAKKQSVKTSEFYNAVQSGYSPSLELVIKRLNYSGEEELKWNNERYSIIRAIDSKNKFDIVLVCSKKTGIHDEHNSRS